MLRGKPRESEMEGENLWEKIKDEENTPTAEETKTNRSAWTRRRNTTKNRKRIKMFWTLTERITVKEISQKTEIRIYTTVIRPYMEVNYGS